MHIHEADGRLPIDLLNDFAADFMVLTAEYTFLADRRVLTFGTDLFPVNEHGEVLNYKLKRLSHRFIQRPRNPS